LLKFIDESSNIPNDLKLLMETHKIAMTTDQLLGY